ncbi:MULTISPECIES: sensor histidine kinase [Polaromonas]|uniref:histidine kinase n=1 Tax=Polaromonas aquatica TaxID=332657 RepID=A0ABW1U3T9_9BURK
MPVISPYRRLSREWQGGCAALLLLTLRALACPYPAHAAEPLHITSAELFAVDGHGFSPPPYTLDTVALPGPWEPVALPHALPPQLVPPGDDTMGPQTVVTWYRTQLPPLASSPEPGYLYIPRWKTDGQIAVYGDGRLLYQSHANWLWNGSNHPLWIPLDETADAQPPQALVLRIERLRATGGAISSLWLGDEAAIGWRYRVRDALQIQLPLMTSAAFLAVGMFALAVWLRQRKAFPGASLYLLFFITSAVSWIRCLHYYAGQHRLPVSDDWFGWLTVNSLFWLVATAHFFLVRLHHLPLPWLNHLVITVTAATSVLTLPVFPGNWPNVTVLAPLAYILLLAMGATAFTCGLRNAWRAGSRDGMLLAGWSLLSLTFGVYDWLLQNNHVSVEGSFLGSYASVGAFFIFMYIMFRRYTGALDGVRQVNASLEEKLQAREAELTQSHIRLRDIEQRQTLSQERQRLMQDMHDGLGSSLVSALRVVEGGRLQEAEVAEVLKSCIDDLKLAIDSMEPIGADLLLLLATLRFRLGNRLESTGIALRWEISDLPALDWLDPRNALHILRILQEALANTLKHAQATEIRVTTSTADGFVTVTIADNGTGFSVAQAMHRGGKGLSNQLRRAQAIGGEVLLESSAAGTQLTLRLPVNRLNG